MQALSQFSGNIQVLFTDIDDTLTDNGQLPASSYSKLWELSQAGIDVIPVTGRPAGWCEMIARQWPVVGVIGENGAFSFQYKDKTLKRHFAQSESERLLNQKKLAQLQKDILQQVPGAALASDQFCRLFDLAIDFCEDVSPLSSEEVQKIVEIFEQQGATAKVSSIHVNGWFGNHNKRTMCETFYSQEYGRPLATHLKNCAFIGDSPNDEPLFDFFPNSFAVANIMNFKDSLESPPKFVCSLSGAKGFVEFADHLLKQKKP